VGRLSLITLNSGVKNAEHAEDRRVEKAGWQGPERFTCGVYVRAEPCSGFFLSVLRVSIEVFRTTLISVYFVCSVLLSTELA
jgi:hypothetical protein